MKKTADLCLQELYSYDYDHALDHRDGLERERSREPCVIAPDADAWGNAPEHKEAV
jgi:hypothetical protein